MIDVNTFFQYIGLSFLFSHLIGYTISSILSLFKELR